MKYQAILTVISFLVTLISTSYSATPTPTPTATPTKTHFGPTYPSTITVSPDQSSAGLSAINSVSQTWVNGPFYPSIKSVVFIAAPTDAQLSLAISGYNWDSIVRQPWYQTGVPTAWQSYINEQEVALQSALDEAIGWSGSHSLKEPSMKIIAAIAGLGVGVMMWL